MRRALPYNQQTLVHDLETASRHLPLSEGPCPACATRSFQLAVIRNRFRVVRCDAFSTLFVNPRPAEGPLIDFYRHHPRLVRGREEMIGTEDSRSEARYRLR